MLAGCSRSIENFREYGQNKQNSDNYYGLGNTAPGSFKSNYNAQDPNQNINRRGDGYNRGHSNYNRGGRR